MALPSAVFNFLLLLSGSVCVQFGNNFRDNLGTILGQFGNNFGWISGQFQQQCLFIFISGTWRFLALFSVFSCSWAVVFVYTASISLIRWLSKHWWGEDINSKWEKVGGDPNLLRLIKTHQAHWRYGRRSWNFLCDTLYLIPYGCNQNIQNNAKTALFRAFRGPLFHK